MNTLESGQLPAYRIMWIVYRLGLAAIALIALIALFVCQYRLSARLTRREAKLGEPPREEPGAIES